MGLKSAGYGFEIQLDTPVCFDNNTRPLAM